ncbi:hypothetical protein TSUD_99510 [Trifolium subterraneum]|uniref:Uncharacterized protein n=1 Tax=Trifolium subterraneum TaxID=3900 RepID=A0A2Z6PFT6_TRISU|nr:hypothetical protein TSUD_99510 [Trifolium subterraneum]
MICNLPRSFSSYFITLIPKIQSPLSIGDFRPISIVGSLYKLVAKVLASRLAKVMDKLISPNQSAFIKGRQLVDGVVAVNEIIDIAEKRSDADNTHLQYADDTLFNGEASMDNLWSLKSILRSFELASGLRVNFSKSSIMGVNVNTEFLGMAERFLHCRVGSIPFTYLGLPVGASHRKDATWQPLLDSLAGCGSGSS